MDKQQLATNIKQLPTNYSTYAVLVFMAVVSYWLNLSPVEQAAMIAEYPWLKHAAPLAGLFSFIAARVWPQNGNGAAVRPDGE